jgi:hypothetical protein
VHWIGRGRHIDMTSPRGYYLDLARWSDPRGPVDADGLPVSRADRRTHDPGEVARYALGNIEIYLEGGSESRRDRVERASVWLADHMEFVPGSFGGWAMPDPPPAYRDELAPGWLSGAVQGECVSVLVRASLLLGVPRALEAAREAFPAFRTPVDEGGFLREVGEKGHHEGAIESLALVEQYAMPERPSMDLLGHVRAVWAVFDYRRATNDDEARRLFERCVSGTEFILDRYDLGYWTRRDLDSRWRGARLPSTAGILDEALALEILHEMTGRDAFAEAARRRRGYAAGLRRRVRASFQRAAFRLANTGAPRC